MSANEKQVGGAHYKGLDDLQHWDVVHRLQWCYLVGAATKYLWRLGKKGSQEDAINDISKAIHFLEKKREQMMFVPPPTVFTDLRGAGIPPPPLRGYRVCEECRKPILDCSCGGPTSAYVNQD